VVGFADLVFSPGRDGARFSAAYRTWLGLTAHGTSPSRATRLLWLNPSDNQGERFNRANVQAGHTWEECEA
jgi:hypothetical protein